MKGFLKELQERNAAGAVQIANAAFSVRQPELDGYADKEIFSIHGKGKLLWAEVSEKFENLPAQSGTQMKILLLIDGRVQANTRMNFYGSALKMGVHIAPPETLRTYDNTYLLPTRVYMPRDGNAQAFSCAEQERTGGSSAENGFYFPIAAYIPFEESVEIRVSHTFMKESATGRETWGSFACGVGYLLDED